MKTYECNVAQKGYYAGRVYWVPAVSLRTDIKTTQPEMELEKLRGAVKTLRCSVERNRVSGKNTEIQDTVLLILNDEAFAKRIEHYICEQSLEAPSAVLAAADDIARELGKVTSEYIRSRQEDVRGVADKLVSILVEEEKGPQECSAICADEISPARLLSIPEQMIGGMLTHKGSPNSHAAILAGNMGIPYLYGNRDAVAEAQKASFIVMDSETGTVIIDPDLETRKMAEERMAQVRRRWTDEKMAQEDDRYYPVCRTKVYANIEGPEEIGALLESGADGVGLFRTEFLFLGRDSMPSEEEQYEAYRRILEAMGDKEVIIRTIDIGSDKKVSWLELPKESNPALGLRGVRVSLEHGELFHVQLRALLRAAAAGNMKLMFPMVASPWEIEEIKERLQRAADELEQEGVLYKIPEIGIMVETPAAALCADELAEKVSFFSIGTNDLTQYTLALDREAQGLEKYFIPHHEGIFRLIKMTADGGHKHHIRVGVCGQLAADEDAIMELVKVGVDELSVPIKKVMATKKLAARAEAALAEEVKIEKTVVSAVADGELIPMSEIPDPAFSGGSMGECFGIMPSNGNVYAPVSGVVTSVAETGHAVTISSDDGKDFLVHVGINTVNLGNKAFRHYVKEGDKVENNQLMMEADLEMIKSSGLSPMIIVVALEWKENYKEILHYLEKE